MRTFTFSIPEHDVVLLENIFSTYYSTLCFRIMDELIAQKHPGLVEALEAEKEYVTKFRKLIMDSSKEVDHLV